MKATEVDSCSQPRRSGTDNDGLAHKRRDQQVSCGAQDIFTDPSDGQRSRVSETFVMSTHEVARSATVAVSPVVRFPHELSSMLQRVFARHELPLAVIPWERRIGGLWWILFVNPAALFCPRLSRCR